MTKVDVISGFLGAGKTTLIRKLLKESLKGEQVVLIENEFGQIGIDSGFLKEAGVEIREMDAGCICCSLVGDFTASLSEVLETYHPDRVIIEPSGVGKLSDVVVAVKNATEGHDVEMGSAVAVVDVQKCKMYMKNFGEFFNNQIESAGTIVLSRTGVCKEGKVEEALELIRTLNDKATVITTPWDSLDGAQILAAIEANGKLEEQMIAEMAEQVRREEEEHEHHHHHHDHPEDCDCGCHEHHHHDHEEHEHHHHDHEEHEHHHHDHEEHEHHHHDHEEHEHHHHDHEEHEHHHHDHEGHEHHHHHGHHHADDVFGSWGFESPKTYTAGELNEILEKLGDSETYGTVLRAKGMVPAKGENVWLHFDMVPGEHEVREGTADVTGRICVIGADIHTDALKELFGVKE